MNVVKLWKIDSFHAYISIVYDGVLENYDYTDIRKNY